MTERIIKKIEHIRALPEHMRLRYAFGAVAVCMIFVIGIWILTLRQGFLQISPEISSGKDQAEETLSNIPATETLKSLKETTESLRVNSNESTADEFLQSELERNTTNEAGTNTDLQ